MTKSRYKTVSLLDCTLTAGSQEQVTKRIDRLLNKEAQGGWRVVGVVFGNRAILERIEVVK